MGSSAVAEQVAFIRGEFERHADPARAPAMARYMKTDMAFYGVSRPDLKRIAGAAKRRFPIDTSAQYTELVEQLWAGEHREDKYAAIEMARRWPAFISFDRVPLYRRLIVEGSWWDFVDEIAIHLVGEVLHRDRPRTRPVLDEWIDDPHMWLRRSAILSQERLRSDTDAAMLFSYCARRLAEREFFIRKAIGWALRSYSKTDPAAVAAFVARYDAELSGVTRREAVKYL